MRTREFQQLLRRTVKKFLEEVETTWDINNGLCEEFATEICELVPDADWFWIDDLLVPELGEEYADCAHCVIQFRKRYYDAECIEGVDHLRDIPLVRNKDKSRDQVLREREEQTLEVLRPTRC